MAPSFYKIRFILVIIISSEFFLLSKSDAQTGFEGHLNIQFIHTVNGNPAIYDTLIYKNKAGNRYEINQVQYFISDIILHNSNGNSISISSDNPIHYVDKDFAKTLNWSITDTLYPGTYDSLSFTFGICAEKNRSFMYKNPPESYMFWPDVLGGGYHYMKINVKYIDRQGQLSNFNCHLGIGRIKNEEGKTLRFTHNHFRINLPMKAVIVPGRDIKVQLIMDIQKWFDTVNTMDFNNYHGIMDDQNAMSLFSENGRYVFSLKLIN